METLLDMLPAISQPQAPPPPPPPGYGLGPLEYAMYAMGLTTPVSRFLAGFTVTESLVWMAKPSFAFDRLGKPISWAVSTNGGTWVPWFMPGLVVGGVMALFL